MSDIDLHGLDQVIAIIYALCLFGAPVGVGLLFLLIGRFVTVRRALGVGLYWGLSVITESIVLWRWWEWFYDPGTQAWVLPYAVGSTAITFGAYLLLRLLIRRIFPKKLAHEVR